MLLFSTKFPSEIATALAIATSTLLTAASRYIQWALHCHCTMSKEFSIVRCKRSVSEFQVGWSGTDCHSYTDVDDGPAWVLVSVWNGRSSIGGGYLYVSKHHERFFRTHDVLEAWTATHLSLPSENSLHVTKYHEIFSPAHYVVEARIVNNSFGTDMVRVNLLLSSYFVKEAVRN